MLDLDRASLGILKLLQEDGRLPISKISEKLSLSETPCWRRLRSLEETGLIKGYRADIDRHKLGLSVMAFVQINCNTHEEASTEHFIQAIRNSPNILSCHNTSGDDDYMLVAVARDLQDYSNFVESVLRKIPGITNIRSNLSLREVKHGHTLPIKL